MSTVNKLSILGNIGKDLSVNGEGDKAYLIIDLATQEYAKGKGKDRDGNVTDYITTWHRAVAFGKQANYVADNFQKGDQIYLEGPLEIKPYEKKDKQGNVIDQYATGVRLIVKTIAGKGSKGQGGSSRQQNTQSNQNSRSQQNGNGRSTNGNGNNSGRSSQPQHSNSQVLDDEDIPF